MAKSKDGDVLPLSSIEFDPNNARVRTERSSYMIRESLQQFGPLRSLVGQRLPDGRVIVRAGNGTLEEAGQIGIDKIRVVERKPDELVVVVADDLDDDKWTQYAIADNRSSDLSDWDQERLSDQHEAVDLSDWFSGEEMAAWGGDDMEDTMVIPDDQPYENKYAIAVECNDEAHQEDVYNKLLGMGYRCKVLT